MKKWNENIFWQVYANVYDLVRFLPPYQNLLKEVFGALDIRPNTKVLDAGCGTGNFINLATSERKAKFTGFDVSDIMLTKARRKIGDAPNVKLLWGNFNTRLSFESDYFDRIVAINSIYAVKNPHFTFSELLRVLKPGGILIIVNPHAKAKFLTAYSEILNSVGGLKKISLFFITLPLFFFNLIIKLKANQKNFHFLSLKDWENMIKSLTVKSMTCKETYMQSYLLKITKKE